MAYCTEESWKIAKEEVAFVKKHNREWGMCEVWEQHEARQVQVLFFFKGLVVERKFFHSRSTGGKPLH